MNVRECTEFDVKTCGPDADLATAAKILWDWDCGVVPVVNDQGKVVGMVTDRDICIATATRAARPSDIRVKDVMSREIATCHADDDVQVALNTMKDARVRRLPVLDRDERVAGIISLNDLAMRAECRAGADVPGKAFLDTMKAISARARDAVPA